MQGGDKRLKHAIDNAILHMIEYLVVGMGETIHIFLYNSATSSNLGMQNKGF